MICAGIDPGTSTYEIFALENEEPFDKITVLTREVREDPSILLKALKDLNADVIAGLSGYGLPIKRFSELDERDLFLMTLNKDKDITMGMRRLIEIAKRDNLNLYTIPGVIHLPTIPEWRKINRIDMGTADKLCSVCLALHQLSDEVPIDKQRFVLVEAGFGFNAFISVKNGKVVDGVGGTSGFPAFSSLGAMDSELAYLLKPLPKSLLFSGGIKSYLRDRGVKIEEVEHLKEYKILVEFILKGIRVAEVSVGKINKVFLSGKVFEIPRIAKAIKTEYEIIKLKGFGFAKQSAEGAAIIANGIANGKFKKIMEHLEIHRARGTVLDYITSEFREYFDFKI